MSASQKQPYSGLQRKLVVGIDVGTTFSGVSYCILDPGIVPVILGVNRYPGQEAVGGAAKIPSVMYYDSNGSVRAAGAEALLESNIEKAQDQQWIKAEWFKLYMRPTHMKSSTDDHIPPLPLNKTVEQVFGDFLRYLYRCTRVYIEETHMGGTDLWNSLNQRANFVLTHPNGWEGAQQAQMRRAAIQAGLVPDTKDGRDRIYFVTEGEASLLYCVGNNYCLDVIKNGEGVIVVDAGGGTIDLSAFRYETQSNEFHEIAPAACDFQGSIYVSRRARAFLQTTLYNSRFGSPDDIDYVTEQFDKTTKLAFKDESTASFIRFGSSRDNDASVGIKGGVLKLQGSDVATFFQPSIVAIQEAIEEQKDAAHHPVASVLLVGGFSASPWLFSKLQDHLHSRHLNLYRPDGHLGKAVADGAVSFLADRFVSGRVARITFGVGMADKYDQANPEHRCRSSTIYRYANGLSYVPGWFGVILAKGTLVSETTVFRRSVVRPFSNRSELVRISEPILAYRGKDPNPQWTDRESDMYVEVCRIEANVQSAVKALLPQRRADGVTYFVFDYTIELLFGLTEHKAQICWIENGVEKRTPAEMVYDHDS